MANRVVRLSKTQAEDITALCSFGSATVARLADSIERLSPTIRKEKIQEVIAAQFGKEKAEPIGRVLFGLATLHRRNFESLSVLLDSISIPSEWDDAQQAKWQECRPAIERLLSAAPVILAAKATDLSFDVERFCVGARIITDIRPIFDPKHEKIVGSTLRQTLRLEFTSLDARVTSMSIGLDADDISRLKKECEEAINKAAVTRNTLQSIGLEEIIIPGEESQ